MNQERIYTVIRAPRISEKSARMAENSKYVLMLIQRQLKQKSKLLLKLCSMLRSMLLT